MDIKQLEFFVIACERGSLSQAAACMYTSQPNVSKTIRSLEHELGRPLLKRSGKGVSPTVYGETVLEYARMILKATATISSLSVPDVKNSIRNVILKLYHLEGTELVLGLDIMILVALVSFPEAQAMTHAGILRGIGRTGYVAKYSLISIAILRPIVTYLLTYPFGMKLYGAWIALLLDQTIRAVFSVIGSIYYTEQLAKLK